jgi:hypothetical protein
MTMLVNLRETFGRQYKIGLDPAADSWRDPWYHTIPTRTGEVYVHGEQHAGVEVRRGCHAVARLREMGFQVHQEGDDLTTFLVPWDRLAEILPLLNPWRRRQLSPERRQKLVEAGAPHRLRPGAGARNSRQGRDPAPSDGPAVVSHAGTEICPDFPSPAPEVIR